LALLIRESPDERGRQAPAPGVVDPHAALTAASLRIDARAMLRSPAVVWVNVAGILITFFVGALVFWAPEFILRYHYGDDKDSLKVVTATFGAVAVPAVLLGTLAGSFIADRLERSRPGEGRLRAIAIGVLISGPLALTGLWAQDRTILYATMGLGVFFNSWYVGPILAVLHDVVPPDKRGTATGIYLLLIHLLGDAISPGIVGFVSRHSSLRLGLTVAAAMLILGGLAALRALPHSRELAKLKRRREAK
jgi:sugar phosphate permease